MQGASHIDSATGFLDECKKARVRVNQASRMITALPEDDRARPEDDRID